MNYLLMTIILLLSLVTKLYFLFSHLIPNAAWRCVLSGSITEAVSHPPSIYFSQQQDPVHRGGRGGRMCTSLSRGGVDVPK